MRLAPMVSAPENIRRMDDIADHAPHTLHHFRTISGPKLWAGISQPRPEAKRSPAMISRAWVLGDDADSLVMGKLVYGDNIGVGGCHVGTDGGPAG